MVVEMKVSETLTTIVDHSRIEELLTYPTWSAHVNPHGKFYVVCGVPREDGSRKTTGLHQVVLGIGGGKLVPDHIDQNPLNNTLCNLRPSTSVINGNNRSLNRNNTSGVNGVIHRVTAKRKDYLVTRKLKGKTTFKVFGYGPKSLFSQEEQFKRAVAYREELDIQSGCTNGRPIDVIETEYSRLCMRIDNKTQD